MKLANCVTVQARHKGRGYLAQAPTFEEALDKAARHFGERDNDKKFVPAKTIQVDQHVYQKTDFGWVRLPPEVN